MQCDFDQRPVFYFIGLQSSCGDYVAPAGHFFIYIHGEFYVIFCIVRDFFSIDISNIDERNVVI
jgi:hypothetical protein